MVEVSEEFNIYPVYIKWFETSIVTCSTSLVHLNNGERLCDVTSILVFAGIHCVYIYLSMHVSRVSNWSLDTFQTQADFYFWLYPSTLYLWFVTQMITFVNITYLARFVFLHRIYNCMTLSVFSNMFWICSMEFKSGGLGSQWNIYKSNRVVLEPFSWHCTR